MAYGKSAVSVMFISAKTLDDIMREIFERMLKSSKVQASKGKFHERVGVLLELQDPRARLSRTETKGKPFSALGELFWYLSGSNKLDFIQYYIPIYHKFSDDKETVYGAYGPRFFSMRKVNQIETIASILERKKTSRQAVIQLFNAEDIVDSHKDVPCTCTLQFLLRRRRLHLIVNMRSNDVFKGLPHDVFSFTMLQEILARKLGAEVGRYKHMIGSMHLYEEDVEAADLFLREGLQATVPMPEMPVGDPCENVRLMVKVEEKIRLGEEIDVAELGLEPYWADLVRLLQVFRLSKPEHRNNKNREKIAEIQDAMSTRIYRPYIEHRRNTGETLKNNKKQSELRLLGD